MTHDLIAAYWYLGAGFVAGCVFMWFCGVWYGRRVLLRAEPHCCCPMNHQVWQLWWFERTGIVQPHQKHCGQYVYVAEELIAEQPQFGRVRR